jgi:hypothetical protein
MRLCTTLLPSLLAGALPLASLAQTTEMAPLPRYYVGLGIYQFPTKSNAAPVTPTFGWQFQPRWAVQASLAFGSQRYSYEGSRAYYDDANPKQYHEVTYSGFFRTRSLALPVLVRYTFTRPQQHRFQADLLGGVTWVRRAFRREEYTIDRAQGLDATNRYDQFSHGLYATIGPSLRCRIWKGLEVTGDAEYNLLVVEHTNLFKSQTEGTLAAGLLYRFSN